MYQTRIEYASAVQTLVPMTVTVEGITEQIPAGHWLVVSMDRQCFMSTEEFHAKYCATYEQSYSGRLHVQNTPSLFNAVNAAPSTVGYTTTSTEVGPNTVIRNA
jgi:hypothetical protein